MGSFINREKKERPTEGVQVPVENFSQRYVNFLTGSCNAHLCEDGVFRNNKGARFCSCEMCGQVSEANFGGEFCVFHMNHHNEPGEANFFTQRLHHYRKAVVLAKTLRLMRSSEGVFECSQLFEAACAEAGIDLGFGTNKDPISLIESHIAHEWDAEKARRASMGSSRKKPTQKDIARQKLANLLSNISGPSISPTFEEEA